MSISRTHYNALVDDDGSNTVGTVWSKARVGDLLDDVDAFVTNWVSYTPTLTNVTLGNGTLTAKWARHNKTILVNVLVLFGSTTSITGSLIVSLPVNNIAAAFGMTLGDVGMYDISATARYRGVAMYDSASTVGGFTNATPLAAINATAPFTWAVNDQFFVSLCYQEP
jgi:hypothetical protein